MSKPDIDKMTRTEVIENLAKAICVMRNAGASRERIIRVVESAIEEDRRTVDLTARVARNAVDDEPIPGNRLAVQALATL